MDIDHVNALGAIGGGDGDFGKSCGEKQPCEGNLDVKTKPEFAKFSEYWIPAHLSDLQLEQYCATFISHSIALSSSSKADNVEVLRDILLLARKCCDHPYLVDEYLQISLTKESQPSEYLDIGVNASGKLLLLDKVLHEIRSQGLRVLILFQSVGAARNSIGDILDDFVRQRFGADSYERVDGGLLHSKKLSAMRMFNDRSSGRFVFLIENRACRPSIKLSSVDAVIIYGSDWNPLNDLRALQKICFEPENEPVIVFRLYSSFTVEEKVLMFAKNDTIMESLANFNRITSQSLLCWGASYLFQKLDEFHQRGCSNHSFKSSEGQFLSRDLVQELLSKIPSNKAFYSAKCSILAQTLQSEVSYSRNIVLAGEKEGLLEMVEDPPSFWSTLLNGRFPKWIYISDPLCRSRRKAPKWDEHVKPPEPRNNETLKRKKVVGGSVEQTVLPSLADTRTEESSKTEGATKKGSHTLMLNSNMPSLICNEKVFPQTSHMLEPGKSKFTSNGNEVDNKSHLSPLPGRKSDTEKLGLYDEKREKLLTTQQSLHLLLQQEIILLCNRLELHENVKAIAQEFLDYVMNHHHVSQETETILQAFNISLCWHAAALEKHKIDWKESLALAKKFLNYTCSDEQIAVVYSKLKMLKKKFWLQKRASKHEINSESLKNCSMLPQKSLVSDPQGNKSAIAGTEDEYLSVMQYLTEQIDMPLQEPLSSGQGSRPSSAKNCAMTSSQCQGSAQYTNVPIHDPVFLSQAAEPIINISAPEAVVSSTTSAVQYMSQNELIKNSVDPSNLIQLDQMLLVNQTQESAPAISANQSGSHSKMDYFIQHYGSQPMMSQYKHDILRTGVQQEPVQSVQPFPLVPFPSRERLHPEPLKNELTRIQLQKERISKMHEDVVSQLQSEFKKEVDTVRRKYNTLLQEAETDFLKNQITLRSIHNKVQEHQLLAEEFRVRFLVNKRKTSASYQDRTIN